MKRITLTPREDWQQRVESLGMLYHTMDGEQYWDESACYRFTRRQIDTLEQAAAELHSLCLQTVEHVVRRDLFPRLHIPEHAVPQIISSWEKQDPSIYGRFDLVWDGTGQPKLLEYNADTPTSLFEAGAVQWFWLQDCFPYADQFNTIHEKLISFWERWPRGQAPTYFICSSGSIEDQGNVEYMRDTAEQGGVDTCRLFVEDIGWNSEQRCFVGLTGEPIESLFKLYPWEWMVHEDFGQYLLESPLRIMEPAWKMILSTKGVLPLLWELFEGHQNLLQASFGDTPMTGEHVRKPLYSREGSNIEIFRNDCVLSTSGSYGEEGHIYQRYAPLPCFDGNFPVIGAWIIGGQPAGIGIREDLNEITTNGSRFIPHYFVEA